MNEMAKADQLRIRLEKHLGDRIDVLGKYRTWLDKNNINAEDDGWPSAEAYDQLNIQSFIESATQ